MNKLILCTFLFILTLTFKPCEPWGTRIFYGQAATSDSDEKLQIYFNTASQCQQSYVHLLKKTGLQKISCETTSLKLSAEVNFYQTYIHKCKLSTIKYEETFFYNIFGWDGSDAQSIPFQKGTYIEVKLADITNPTRKIKLIVLADWSPIIKNIGKYKSIDHDIYVASQEQEINGLLINGDIGYDLDTNNCTNYQNFLVMLSKTSASIPVIIATGNHQYNTKDNFALYSNSFQLYNVDSELSAGITLGGLYLVPFDPFQVLFNKKTITNDPTIEKFTQILKEAKDNGKFIVPTSHYPLACSGTSKNCKNDRKDMKAYWSAMFDSKVSLYLGAHYHTYQRNSPYLQDNTFSTQKDNFRSDQNYIISIVEGVAGNDKDIVESLDTIQSFTESYTVNETGFGILVVEQGKVNYQHYSTSRGMTDEINIARNIEKPQGNLMRE